jgi:hypothetical protein
VVCLQWVADIRILGVCSEKKRMGLWVCVNEELKAKSDWGEITKNVTIRLRFVKGTFELKDESHRL